MPVSTMSNVMQRLEVTECQVLELTVLMLLMMSMSVSWKCLGGSSFMMVWPSALRIAAVSTSEKEPTTVSRLPFAALHSLNRSFALRMEEHEALG